MPCAICKTAKAKRFCPGIGEEICTGCCATSRENTIDCPISCEFLAEAHKHEKKPAQDPEKMPGQDVPLDDDFLRANEFLIVLLGSAMSEAVRPHAGATDADAVDALDCLAKTWRTQISGLYYETKPVNPIALEMFDAIKARVEDIRTRMQAAESTQTLPDNIVLGVIVFLQRVAFGMNNSRKLCKAFLVFLAQFYVNMKEEEEEAIEAIADEPRVIL